MRDRHIERECAKWKQRLGVGFDVTVDILPRAEMEGGNDGYIQWDRESIEAKIQLAEDADLIPTLVHELQHLVLETWEPKDETERVIKERVIERYTRICLSAYPQRARKVHNGL